MIVDLTDLVNKIAREKIKHFYVYHSEDVDVQYALLMYFNKVNAYTFSTDDFAKILSQTVIYFNTLPNEDVYYSFSDFFFGTFKYKDISPAYDEKKYFGDGITASPADIVLFRAREYQKMAKGDFTLFKHLTEFHGFQLEDIDFKILNKKIDYYKINKRVISLCLNRLESILNRLLDLLDDDNIDDYNIELKESFEQHLVLAEDHDDYPHDKLDDISYKKIRIQAYLLDRIENCLAALIYFLDETESLEIFEDIYLSVFETKILTLINALPFKIGEIYISGIYPQETHTKYDVNPNIQALFKKYGLTVLLEPDI
jgi:hypothetical protein